MWWKAPWAELQHPRLQKNGQRARFATGIVWQQPRIWPFVLVRLCNLFDDGWQSTLRLSTGSGSLKTWIARSLTRQFRLLLSRVCCSHAASPTSEPSSRAECFPDVEPHCLVPYTVSVCLSIMSLIPQNRGGSENSMEMPVMSDARRAEIPCAATGFQAAPKLQLRCHAGWGWER